MNPPSGGFSHRNLFPKGGPSDEPHLDYCYVLRGNFYLHHDRIIRNFRGDDSEEMNGCRRRKLSSEFIRYPQARRLLWYLF